jgi:hypothetical protein
MLDMLELDDTGVLTSPLGANAVFFSPIIQYG